VDPPLLTKHSRPAARPRSANSCRGERPVPCDNPRWRPAVCRAPAGWSRFDSNAFCAMTVREDHRGVTCGNSGHGPGPEPRSQSRCPAVRTLHTHVIVPNRQPRADGRPCRGPTRRSDPPNCLPTQRPPGPART
jgi:hypothetical protein